MKNRDCWAEYDNDNGGDDDDHSSQWRGGPQLPGESSYWGD